MPKVINPVPRFNYHTPEDASSTIVAKFSCSFKDGKKRMTYSPGIKIEKKFWDFKNQRPKPHPSANQIRIRSDLNRLEEIILKLHEETQGSLSFEEFRKELDYRFKGTPRPEEERKSLNFLQFAKQYILEQSDRVKTGEIQNQSVIRQNTWVNKLEEYCLQTNEQLLFESIDSSFRKSFIAWCYNQQNNINTVSRGLSVIRQIMRAALEAGLTENRFTETKAWKLPKQKTSDIALSESEIETIFNLDLKAYPEGYQKARQLFLIGAYTGLRISDYKRINPSHINTEQGVQVIKITAQKTGKLVSIPLHPNLKAILEECSYQSPSLSEQKLNKYIKEVARLAGITEEQVIINTKGGKSEETIQPKYELIKSHTARRSFATISIAKGIPARIIMVITGHSTEQQLNNYIKSNQTEAIQEYLKTYEVDKPRQG